MISDFLYIAVLGLVVSGMIVGIYYAVKGFPPASRLVEETPPTPIELEEGTANFYMFYTDWCPHCTTAKPLWDSLDQSIKNGKSKFGDTTVNILKVNCQSDSKKCDGYGVNSYPTFKLDALNKRYEYQGAPSVSDWKHFLTQVLGSEKTTP